MPLLEKTAGSPAVREGAHTDSGAAFVPDQSRAERPTSFDVADFPSRTAARRSGGSRRSTGCARCSPTRPPRRARSSMR